MSFFSEVKQGVAAALSGAWPVKLTDGLNVLGLLATPVRTDPTGTTPQPVELVDGYGFAVEATPLDELRVATAFRLVGATFVGTTIDTNFWTATVADSGTAAQAAGEATLVSGVNASASATLQSVRPARYIGAASNRFRTQLRLTSASSANCSAKWGAFNGVDGCYFELDGAVLYAVTLDSGVATRVDVTAAFLASGGDLLKNASYELYYTNGKVQFTYSGNLLHTHVASATHWAATLNLPARLSVTNSGVTAGNSMVLRSATIVRFGLQSTEAMSHYVTTAATTVLKRASGRLHRVTLGIPTGTALTLYDNTAGSGTILFSIDTPTQANPVTLELQFPFHTGLTVVSTGTWGAVVVYE